ncbi:hypothetical protein Fot_13708 [Forsythia ovata]|uniref:Uncharacterized protein n=1 Tax=Forsythia ovata TaxID=205694 RepID=A0ABD1W7R5_9LAMI
MRLPRMCLWNSCLTPESRDIAEVLDDPQLHVRCTLHASPDDREEEYVRLFVSNLRKEDPILNAYFYKDGADDVAEDKEPDDIFEQVREDDLPRSPESVEKLVDASVETTVEGEVDAVVDTGVGEDRVKDEVEAPVDTEVRTTVDGDQEKAVNTYVDTTIEGEVKAAVDTGVGTTVGGDAEEADQPHSGLHNLSEGRMYKKNLKCSYAGVREKP